MTIKDLARQTGYSVGTVSRVLNGQPNVSDKAKQAILDCAEKSGFQLNMNAKYLKQQRGDGVMALVTGTSNELFAHMIEHIQRELSQTQYPLTVDYLEENEDAVRHALRISREKKPLGLLFLGGNSQMFAQNFGNVSLPSVALTADASGLPFPNLSSVTTDDAAAAECAIDYLYDCGHREIGVITGDLLVSGPSRLRYTGCSRALVRHGIDVSEARFVTARYSYAAGYDAALRLIAKNSKITAIFAMSDVMAIGAIRALHDRGLRVPEDISVIGFDGIDPGTYYIPNLTTIRQHVDLLAKRGVALLLQGIENRAVATHETVPFALVERDSVIKRNFREG